MILESSKLVYFAARTVFKIFLGKKNRDDLWLKNDFNFPNFLYRATSITGIKKYITLSLNVPKYNYEICCPLNREDFIIVTRHEEEIIDRFEPKVGGLRHRRRCSLGSLHNCQFKKSWFRGQSHCF